MQKQYSFTTHWLLDADIGPVWDCIMAVEQWPEWWPAVRTVTPLQPGGSDGVGKVTRFTWRGCLPYRLTFDMRVAEVVRHRRLGGIASGELQGTGVWHFDPIPDGTYVRYDWRVRTAKPWMNLLAPVFEPAFRWNHDHVMATGGAGLARRLGCCLHRAQPPS
jgi:hypothetical protein